MLNELSFEIIQKCPNKCIYCSSNSSINAQNLIEYNTFVKVIDDAILLGLKRLCISGGEPFLHPDLIRMLEYTNKKNLEVYIYTSGVVRNDFGNYISIPRYKLERLSDSKVNKLIFNMQAAEEEIYDAIMGTKGFYSLLLNSIKSSSEYGLYTEIHFVPMKINYDQIEKMINVAKELKVQKISFLRFVLQGRACNNASILSMNKEEQELLKGTLERVKLDNDIDTRIGIPLLEPNERVKCNAGWGKLIIRYDGAVFPCEAFKYIDYYNTTNKVYPDNINSMSLVDIWKKSIFLNTLRNEIADFHANSYSCETCPAQWKISKREKAKC